MPGQDSKPMPDDVEKDPAHEAIEQANKLEADRIVEEKIKDLERRRDEERAIMMPLVQKDGGPAFPPPLIVSGADPNSLDVIRLELGRMQEQGMSLRDYFAAKAMQGNVANSEVDMEAKHHAEWAYKVADAMLKERSK